MKTTDKLTICEVNHKYYLDVTHEQWGVSGVSTYVFNSTHELLHFLQAFFHINQSPLREEWPNDKPPRSL